MRGSCPGTRETDLLRPTALISEVHAVVLSGGSAFGLDAASGVVRYLEEKGVGLQIGEATLPVVPGAVLFDLGVVTDKVRPGAKEGYMACQNASSGPVAECSVGAGTGATVAKLMGMEHAVKGGVGTASVDLGHDLVAAAVVAVNALGGVYDPHTGEVLAGPRRDDGTGMHDAMELITSPGFGFTSGEATNTTIGVVSTNARLNKEETNKLASVAHDGMALAVRPAHTMTDGDTIFALATGTLDHDVVFDRVLAASVLCLSQAIARGVRKAEGIGGVPSVRELTGYDSP